MYVHRSNRVNTQSSVSLLSLIHTNKISFACRPQSVLKQNNPVLLFTHYRFRLILFTTHVYTSAYPLAFIRERITFLNIYASSLRPVIWQAQSDRSIIISRSSYPVQLRVRITGC